jgi:hypothetical protein
MWKIIPDDVHKRIEERGDPSLRARTRRRPHAQRGCREIRVGEDKGSPCVHRQGEQGIVLAIEALLVG